LDKIDVEKVYGLRERRGMSDIIGSKSGL